MICPPIFPAALFGIGRDLPEYDVTCVTGGCFLERSLCFSALITIVFRQMALFIVFRQMALFAPICLGERNASGKRGTIFSKMAAPTGEFFAVLIAIRFDFRNTFL